MASFRQQHIATNPVCSCSRSPVIITMARSALDEFTPPEQVEQIQEAAIATLKKVYPEVEVHFNYDD